MAVLVQKFGGASLASPEMVKSIAGNAAALAKSGRRLIVVISAMGKTTDQLIDLAGQVSARPVRRELDMLLSTGERVASALMSMAINEAGAPAVSFTGSQAGILTDDAHTNAKIVDLRPTRIESELQAGRVVVLAGFQGVSPTTKEVTTLGRGGTDLTAVCMAYHFKAERCEILKEVDGVFSADPRLEPNARRIPHLSFEALQELTFWGAKMVHHRAAELAARFGQKIFIGLAHGTGDGTVIDGAKMKFEQEKVLSVNSHADVVKLTVSARSQAEGWKKLEEALHASGIAWPQVLDSTQTPQGTVLLLTGSKDDLAAVRQLGGNDFHIERHALCSVTATCAGSIGSPVVGRLAHALEGQGIQAYHVLISPMSATFILDSTQLKIGVQTLHAFSN